MAKNRYIGDYPVIGIRPVVDGRRGPQMMRESLEPQVWAMANAAKRSCGTVRMFTATSSITTETVISPHLQV